MPLRRAPAAPFAALITARANALGLMKGQPSALGIDRAAQAVEPVSIPIGTVDLRALFAA